jgi:hypothetical protein
MDREEAVHFGPVVVVSRDGTRGIELSEYEGREKVLNRDAEGYYFTVRADRDGPTSRIQVVFDGMAMQWLKPSVFKLPDVAPPELAFVHFSETAIGDRLDEPKPLELSSDGLATSLECLSSCVERWKTRAPADEEAIEAYIRARLFWSWQFGYETAPFKSSDYLRLGISQSRFLRIVEFGSPELWSISWRTPISAILAPAKRLLTEERERRREGRVNKPQPQPHRIYPAYVEESRLQELRDIRGAPHDLRRLVALCEELNVCSANDCYHAMAILTRAIIDHVPPIFNVKGFKEVASSYPGSKSFRDSMEHLSGSARKIADAHLHVNVRRKEVLPTRTQVDFSRDLDVLLSEVVRILRSDA